MSNVKVLKVLTRVFAVLAIFGGIYVIATGGKINAGIAVVPLVFSLAFSSKLRSIKIRNNSEEEDTRMNKKNGLRISLIFLAGFMLYFIITTIIYLYK